MLAPYNCPSTLILASSSAFLATKSCLRVSWVVRVTAIKEKIADRAKKQSQCSWTPFVDYDFSHIKRLQYLFSWYSFYSILYTFWSTD